MDEDVISRTEAIDIFNAGAELLRRVLDDIDVVGVERENYEWVLGLIESYISDIKDLPSAQLVRKKSRWIQMSDADGIYWTCNECGEDIPRIAHFDPQFDLFPRMKSIDKTNFCPNCGADMRGDKDEID